MTPLIEAPSLASDKDAAPYIATEIVKWERFEKASFVCDSNTGVATFSVEVPVSRSTAAAIEEARNAIVKMLYAAIREPGAYTIEALSVGGFRSTDSRVRLSMACVVGSRQSVERVGSPFFGKLT